MKICRARSQLVFNVLLITGLAALGGQVTVCPLHNFPPPSELLVCYQPNRHKVIPGQKSKAVYMKRSWVKPVSVGNFIKKFVTGSLCGNSQQEHID
jgi:hypothetical protein